jgi:hypothetical protein
MALYFHFQWLLWAAVFFVAVDVLARLYVRRTIARRLNRLFTGKSATIELSSEFLHFEFDGSKHDWPWSKVLSARRDAKNLLLFLTRLGAIVVPLESAPCDAINYAEERVGNAHRAV